MSFEIAFQYSFLKYNNTQPNLIRKTILIKYYPQFSNFVFRRHQHKAFNLRNNITLYVDVYNARLSSKLYCSNYPRIAGTVFPK